MSAEWDYQECMMQYDIQQRRACNAEIAAAEWEQQAVALMAENEALRDACEGALWLLGNDADRRRLGNLRLISVHEIPNRLRGTIGKSSAE